MKKIIKLILLIIWMGLIFSFSNQNANQSDKLSKSVIVKVAQIFVDENLSEQTEAKIINNYTTLIRKAAHFTIYFILGILIYSYLSEYKLNHLIICSIILSLLYACTDEIHQLFIDGRSGEIRDVIIDTVGSTIGILSYYKLKIERKKEVRNEKKL